MKVCSKCSRELPADKIHFFANINTRDGFHSKCKECDGHEFSYPKIVKKIGYKVCTKCGEELPATSYYFPKCTVKTDGLRNDCKTCKAIADKVYSEENRESIATNKKNHYQENREPILEKQRKYWHRTNPQRKLNNIINKVYIDKRIRANRIKTRVHLNMMAHVRRSMKRNLAHTLTVEQWEQAKLYFNNKCVYCGSESTLTQDHHTPLNKGGEYTKENIVPACLSCNSSKGDRLVTIWYPKQPFYYKKNEDDIFEYLGYTKGIQQLSLM